MIKFKKILIVSTLSISCFALGTLSSFAFDISWKGGYEQIYFSKTIINVASGMSTSFKTATNNAIEEWDSEFLSDQMGIGYASSVSNYYTKNSKNEVTLENRGENELGICRYVSINLLALQIKEFDINMNTFYPWGVDGESDKFDFQSVMTHEIGHGLGFGHSDVTGATMLQGTAKGETYKRTLHPDDKAALAYIY